MRLFSLNMQKLSVAIACGAIEFAGVCVAAELPCADFGGAGVPCPVCPAPGWYALATRRSDGGVRLLLTAYGAKDALRLKVKGATFKSATTIVEKGEPVPFKDFTFEDGVLCLPKPAHDAVYLLR